jgi:hypothetical protein
MALIPVCPGDYVVDAEHNRGDCTVLVRRITNDLKAAEAGFEIQLVPVCNFSHGEWVPATIPEFLQGAVDAACGCALTYNNQKPWHIA